MKCPCCGGEMTAGYIKSPKEIFWDTDPKIKFVAAKNGIKICEPDSWDGFYKQAFYCPACRRILIDL